jgi:hypothetical protein
MPTKKFRWIVTRLSVFFTRQIFSSLESHADIRDVPNVKRPKGKPSSNLDVSVTMQIYMNLCGGD